MVQLTEAEHAVQPASSPHGAADPTCPRSLRQSFCTRLCLCCSRHLWHRQAGSLPPLYETTKQGLAAGQAHDSKHPTGEGAMLHLPLKHWSRLRCQWCGCRGFLGQGVCIASLPKALYLHVQLGRCFLLF